MHMKFIPLFVCLIIAAPLTAGCTTEAWYEGMRRSAENECRMQGGSSPEECLARLNKQSYQQYEKERAGSKSSK